MNPGTAAAPSLDGGAATLAALADYAIEARVADVSMLALARTCLVDALAGAFRALRQPDCERVLGPVVPGATMTCGARVPGTSYELDPVQAAFNLGALFGWTAPAAATAASGAPRECRPADTLGALLAVADWRSRRAAALGEPPLRVVELLDATIRAHAIHAALAGANGVHALGCDDAFYARLAIAAVATALLGGPAARVQSALAHALLDGAPLRLPPSAVRARWAVAEAASRGVRHALHAVACEPVEQAALPEAVAVFEHTVLRATFACPPPDAAGTAAVLRATDELEAQHRLAAAAAAHFAPKQAAAIAALCADSAKLMGLAVHDLVSALVKN